MRIVRYILLILAVLCLMPQMAKAEKERRHVLLINSYHQGYKWTDSEVQGLKSVLDVSDYKIDLQIEYMDSKRYQREDITEMLVRLYREKYDSERFDVIVTTDNDAYDFMTKHRQELFPGVPLVFCGVNDLDAVSLFQGDVTGVGENFDPALTLDVALKLNPDMKRMIVVGDESSAGVTIRRQVEAVVPSYRDRLSVEYWTANSLTDVLDRVRKLPENTFLFFIPYYQTVGDRFYTAEEVMTEIYKHAEVPIYTSWEFLLGNGAVGGWMVSGFRHGQEAASMVLRILSGESVDDIPVLQTPTGRFSFDYNVLWRLGIDEEKLPEGSRIINAPSPFYELPKELFWTIMISFVLLNIVMVFLIITMIERRKIERKVKDQLAFQEILMDTVPHLVSWKDKHGRYLGTNQAFAEFFGFKDGDEVVNRGASGVIRDQAHVRWAMAADGEVLRNGREFYKVRRKLSDASGTRAWLVINKVPIRDQAGQIVGVLSTAENITKEYNLEKQLLQSQKMEAIGTLAGGIAHDFNNILTSIINSTELAVGDLDPDTVTSKDLQRVLKAARRGGRVVKQILAFSRPSTEGFRPTDVGAVISEALSLLEASLPGNIEVKTFIGPRLDYVHADPTQLHQVAMNLCTNSFQALRPAGGTIEVRVENAKLEKEEADLLAIPTGEYIRLTVEDNGPGIPIEIVDKIFDPFFSTKDKTEGTGLGLAVVHGIVRSHKGALRVFMRPGGGTVFEIYLPKTESSMAGGRALGKVMIHGGAHILFVEDDEDQLHTTPRLLETMGFAVTAIRAPEEALARVRGMSHLYDLVITDYDMPGMSGTQLAEAIKEFTPNMPVILVSGREDAAMAAAHLPNIRQVIIKPYDKDDLSAAIGNVLLLDKEG
ncbi:ABC transporter substrate binding protein [Pseudodesulfovibrio sp. zrk46]|uniref:hybrid sensor histidine kinase/response regulator n=1 Tax=Pseudodesulfovibrio sp. zrk46 TaxID=2725288 RepID=UPI001449D453|nr:ABC transporter substrate binding protein [Pseudodesulfovibrio sp. zrk46]QJB55052.1 response regulator [Pseudodesulfovibrio sp. zrk46]